METYRDTVAVALIAQPENPENYSISVIPDTQGNTYSSMIFPKAENSDSELVIHLGDIVDGVNTSEFDEAKDVGGQHEQALSGGRWQPRRR